jgi:hypothetical protein
VQVSQETTPAAAEVAKEGLLPAARPLVLISAAIALLFAAYVFWQYTDDVDRTYSGGVSASRDLAYLLSAGYIIRGDEAKTLYLLPPDAIQWHREHGFTYPTFYPYPPATALLTSLAGPFKEDGSSIREWRVAVALASFVLAVCVASAFKSAAWRVAAFISVLWWPPVLENAAIGQTGAFVAALMAVCVLVFMRLPVVGAALFGLLALKPTVLIAPALIVLQQRPALWLIFGAVAAAVLLLPFVWLGSQALSQYIDILEWRAGLDAGGGHSYNQALAAFIRAPTAVWVGLAVGGLVIAAALVHLVEAKLGANTGIGFAILLACIVNPHSMFYDWGLAMVGLMVLRRSALFPEHAADLAVGVLVVALFLAGDWSRDLRVETGTFLRPLTAWTIVVCAALAGLALWRAAYERGLLLRQPPLVTTS